MSVKVGSARIDENGRASGGRAGDQTGKEVSTQSWYRHSKGWRVFRAKSPEAAEKIAWDMQAACDNSHIGYDQGGRLTLYEVSKPLGFNCKKVNEDCETDCSALVRVCCAYAGIMLPNFRTSSEPADLLASGMFVELTGSRYTDSPDYLRRGDILVTRTQGHTVVVLSNGSKSEVAPVPDVEGLRYGDEGEDVRAMQRALLAWDATCLPRYGADGDFGSETQKAVEDFQQDAGLTITGVYDAATRRALAEHNSGGCNGDSCPVNPPTRVKITGGTVNVRSAPSLSARVLGYAHKGDMLPYQGETRAAEGRDWHLVEFGNQNGWVSAKMSELVQE